MAPPVPSTRLGQTLSLGCFLVSEITDTGYVRRQYSTESNLETRRSVWRDSPDGRNPATLAADAVRTEHPSRILEVGCGTGVFAARLCSENPDAELLAIDQSSRFVELTAERGVPARQADIQHLPLEDASYDVVVAMWMLYHVPDLDRGLAECRRVLRPGGLFVAVTNGDDHLADLMIEAGGSRNVTQFSRENGEAVLRHHFDEVTVEPVDTRAVFDDHAAAVAYLSSFDATMAERLPWFEGGREYTGTPTVFLAR